MTAVLEIRGIAKQFGGLSALDGVAFTVGEGELVGLVGPNGAGKSTLFNIIAGALPPTRGQVFLRGRDVTYLASHDRARHGIARTFQQVTLFSELTALDNVLQGLHRHVPPRFVAGVLGTPPTGGSSASSRPAPCASSTRSASAPTATRSPASSRSGSRSF